MIDLVKKERIPAMIDGKDVTTDWLESVFDSDDVSRDCRMMIGFINHCVVACSWNTNNITWEISRSLGYGEPIAALMVLEERLKLLEVGEEFDENGIYSTIEMYSNNNKYQIIQNFYFKED